MASPKRDTHNASCAYGVVCCDTAPAVIVPGSDNSETAQCPAMYWANRLVHKVPFRHPKNIGLFAVLSALGR